MMKYLFSRINLTTSLLVLSLLSFAQTGRIAILKTTFDHATVATQKIDALLALCDESQSMNIDTFSRYAILARQMAPAIKDKNNRLLANLVYIKWLMRKNLLDSAMKLCDSCLSTSKYLTANDAYAMAYTQKCYILMKCNRHKEGLDCCYRFLAEAELKEDLISQVCCKSIIASIFSNMQQTDQSLQWSLKAAGTGGDSLYLETKNNFGAYFLTGMMYNWKAAAGNNRNDVEKDSLLSEYYLDKGIEYSRRYENLPMLARALCTKASGIEDPRKLSLAGNYLNEAIDLYKQLGDTVSIINSLAAFSDYYLDIGDPQRAIESCLKGIALANNGHWFPLADLYSKLGDCYKAAGDHIKYEETLKKLLSLNDEVYRTNSARELAYLNAKYEAQKKEYIIMQQQYDISRKNYLFYGTTALLAVILVLGYAFFQNRKKGQKLKMQQVIFDQKKNTAAAVMQAEEDERKRIAEELHDSVAQKMVAAKLNLGALEGELTNLNGHQQKVMNNISSLLDESCTEVRSLSHSMMPQAFFKSGLTDAVNDMLEKINNKQLYTNFHSNGDLSVIGRDKEIIIYRLIQECVQNVLKHASADKLDISLNVGNDQVDITIEDNGIGFNPQAAMAGESLGMKNIRSRIEYLNGEYEIDSRPGRGTIIVFYIPVT